MIKFMDLNEKQKEQIAYSQGTAHHIETILGRIFNKNTPLRRIDKEYNFCGMINADEIRKHPFLSMTQGLAVIYYIDETKRKQIFEFFEHFYRYDKMSIDEIYWFDEKTKQINDTCMFELEKDNGIEELEYMISEFEKIIK